MTEESKIEKNMKIMVLILNGNPEYVAQGCSKKVFSEKKIRFLTALDLNKSL